MDAEQTIWDFAIQCLLLSFTQPTIVKEPINSGHSRPKKYAKPTGYHYFIDTTPDTVLNKVKLDKLKIDMFILATNNTTYTDPTTAALFDHYKSSQKVECKFHFSNVINFPEEASANRSTANVHDA